MSEFIQHLTELAAKLVTPDRFGNLALRGFTTELDRTPAIGEEIVLPETNRVYAPNRPLPPDTERTLERLDRLGRL